MSDTSRCYGKVIVCLTDEMRQNCYLGKCRHFSASERDRQYQMICGVPAMIINILLSSLFFVMVHNNLPEYAKWIGAALTLVAAICAAIQTFFNFDRSCQEHRKIANRYLALERECERVLAIYYDRVASGDELHQAYKSILERYNQINSDAEASPTKTSDFRKALQRKNEYETKKRPMLSRLVSEALRDGGGWSDDRPLRVV